MKKQLTLILGILFLTLSVNAQSSLRILNPDWWDEWGEPGTIEEAVVTMAPKGLYTEVGLYLTLSAQGLGYSLEDTMEIVLDFNLPIGSIVHDSWLWMNDSLIVKADILPKWEAQTIYDEIVGRRRDPSVLYETGNGGYELRVFPLAGTESRKVKITYLVPAIWSENTVDTWIPTGILQTTENPLSSVRIINFPDFTWQAPTIKGLDNGPFQNSSDPFYGLILYTDIAWEDLNKPLKFSVNAPFNDDGVFVYKMEDIDDNFYQVAYLPPPLEAADSKKVLFLINHLNENTQIDKKALFYYVKETILKFMEPVDFFNIMLATEVGSQLLFQDWISADPIVVEQEFDIFTDPVHDHSDILELVESGIDYVKNNGGEADILLITSNLEYYSYQTTNALLDQIGDDDIRINVAGHFNSENYYSSFLYNISRYTSGDYNIAYYNSDYLWESIDKSMSTVFKRPYDFDFHLSLENGFAVDRYYQTYLGQSGNLNQPVLQTGKYYGNFPIELEFGAIAGNEFVFEDVIISENDIIQGDSLNREIWFGNHLDFLENSLDNYQDRQEIIDLSIEERVLTRYTAFLALEVAQGGEPCAGCWDYEIILVDTEEEETPPMKIEVTASPNPFSDYIKLDFALQGENSYQQLDIRIFDVYGKLVEVVDPTALLNFGTMQWTWDGKDENGNLLSSGIYFLVVKTDKGIQNIKLSLIR